MKLYPDSSDLNGFANRLLTMSVKRPYHAPILAPNVYARGGITLVVPNLSKPQPREIRLGRR